MNDRELLELAAKAAGYQPQGMEDGKLYLYGVQYGWNPLQDDGDALRLAAKLGLEVYIGPTRAVVWKRKSEWDVEDHVRTGVDDIYTATRRAIVRAAAEIGRVMS